MQSSNIKIKDLQKFSQIESPKIIHDSLHAVSIYRKINQFYEDNKKTHKYKKEWFIKQMKSDDIFTREHMHEVLCADIMRIFIKLIPKTRIALKNDEIYILSEKVGWNQETETYFTTETLYDHLEAGGSILAVKSQFMFIHAINAIIGNIDARPHNIIVFNDGKNTHLVPIDFGLSFIDLKNKPSFIDKNKIFYGLFNCSIVKLKASREEWFAALKNAIQEYKTARDLVKETMIASCEKHNIPTQYGDSLLAILDKNMLFIDDQIKFYESPFLQRFDNSESIAEIDHKEFTSFSISEKLRYIDAIVDTTMGSYDVDVSKYNNLFRKVHTILIRPFLYETINDDSLALFISADSSNKDLIIDKMNSFFNKFGMTASQEKNFLAIIDIYEILTFKPFKQSHLETLQNLTQPLQTIMIKHLSNFRNEMVELWLINASLNYSENLKKKIYMDIKAHVKNIDDRIMFIHKQNQSCFVTLIQQENIHSEKIID